jgi:hypothetical protein
MILRLLFSTIILFVISCVHVNAQNHAFSTTWRQQRGQPQPGIDWTSSIRDENGNTITVGNTLNENGQSANFLMTKLDKDDGSVLWEVEWNGASNGNDYATAVTVNGNAIYVCGVTTVSNNVFRLVALRLNATTGSTVWEYIYTSATQLYSIPSAIIADGSGVYITGTVAQGLTASDYLTLCLNPYDGIPAWTTIYDYNLHYDAGLKMAFVNSSLVVTGMSGVSFNNSWMTAIEYDKVGGAQLTQATVMNLGNFIDEPTDIISDSQGNVYIAGKFHTANEGVDIKVVKLSSGLALDWSYQWDGDNADDIVNAIATDNEGHVFLTGYTTNADNKKEMVSQAVDEDGNKLWEQRKRVKPLYDETAGIDIEYAHGHLIALGYVSRGNNKNLITCSFTFATGFPRWCYEISEHLPTSKLPTQLSILDNETFVVNAIQSSNNVRAYFSAKINVIRRNRSPHLDAQGKPDYAAHEVIIRFDPTVLNNTTIDKTDLGFGKLSDFITQDVLDQINSKFEQETKDFKLVKIFPWLTSHDTTSVARDGTICAIPAFYSWLTLELPEEFDPIWVCEQLSQISSIINMSVNQVSFLDDVPNDNMYLDFQSALHFVPGFFVPSVADYDIHMEHAWDYQTGYSYLQDFHPLVGVYDTGVLYTHEDLTSIIGETVVGGLDFVAGGSTTVFDTGDPSEYGHGTKVSGVISATRNNNLGVAGVAGGNDDGLLLEELPIPLQVSRIVDNLGYYPYLGDSLTHDSLMHVYWDAVTAAQIFSALSILVDNPVTVINQSHSGSINLYGAQWGVTDEMTQVNRTLFNQQCVNVCSRGNNYNQSLRWPGVTLGPEIQQMAIGASDSLGLKADFSNYGGGVDIIAPGDNNLVWSTANLDDAFYSAGNGTSFSTPQVTGISALMQAYVNNNVDAPNDLSPEDIEILIEKFADDIVDTINAPSNYTIGYDDYSGWGKLNAGAIFDGIALPYFRIWHFDISIAESDLIQLPNMTMSWDNSVNFYPGNFTDTTYEFEVYKIQLDNYHGIDGAHVIDAWGRNSASTVVSFKELFGGGYQATPFPDVQIEYVDDDHAIITAYVFKFADSGIWFPFQPIANNIHLSYTLYTEGGYTGLKEWDSEQSFKVYPNPNRGNFVLEYTAYSEGQCKIQVIDSQGRVVFNKDKKLQHAGLNRENINLENIASGLYFVSILTPTNCYNSRILKE